MTKAQIKAELRRCALYENNRYGSIHAFYEAYAWRSSLRETLVILDDNEWRMFYLFIAEAL